MIWIYLFLKVYILDSEWSAECNDFIMGLSQTHNHLVKLLQKK